jgi:hypothetical protein
MRIVHRTGGNDPEPGRAIEELARQLARRREASLRLPPLPCGCHDPEEPRHIAARCRYPLQQVACLSRARKQAA